MLRIDTAVHIYGVRINVWVAIFTLLLGVGMFLGLGRRHRGQTDESPARSLAPAPSPEGPQVKRVAARAKANVGASADGPSVARPAARAKGAPGTASKPPKGTEGTRRKPKSP